MAAEFVPPVGAQKKLYGDVPPDSETEAEPFAAPQVADCAVAECFKTVGWLMVAVAVAVQPSASMTVTLIGPAGKFWAVWVVAPLDQFHEIGAVPPVGVAVAVPLFPPKQETFTVFEIKTVGPAMLKI